MAGEPLSMSSSSPFSLVRMCALGIFQPNHSKLVLMALAGPWGRMVSPVILRCASCNSWYLRVSLGLLLSGSVANHISLAHLKRGADLALKLGSLSVAMARSPRVVGTPKGLTLEHFTACL